MMDYQMFKMVVKENIKNYLPLEFRDAIVEIHSVNKINGKRDALAILKDDKQEIAPNLYLENYFQIYERTDDLEMVLSDIAEEYAAIIASQPLNKPALDISQMKERAVMMLVNTEQNKELLANVPHREMQDLSVIYRFVVSTDEKGVASFIITNEQMDMAGMTQGELFKCAAENTKKILPPVVKSLGSMIQETINDNVIENLLGVCETETNVKEKLWVISNLAGVNGAASMLYDETLHSLAEKIGTDLYIVPSSIHEVLAVSVESRDVNPESLAEILQDINMSSVIIEERLSNNVYHYDKDLRKLSLATDVPNKRLDGIVAEPEPIYNDEPRR